MKGEHPEYQLSATEVSNPMLPVDLSALARLCEDLWEGKAQLEVLQAEARKHAHSLKQAQDLSNWAHGQL